MVLLLLALGCGLVASIGISQVIERRNQAAAPAGETEPIYVALKDIKINEPLSAQNLKLEEWPKEKVPSDAVRDIKDIEGQRAGSTILSGEPLRKAKFAMDKRIDEIPPGYRVVAVPADPVSATGYLLQPGDRVDVLVYVNRNAINGVNQSGTKTILQDVRVFAVNEQWRPSEDKSDPIAAKTVSLLVTPAQAEVVTLACEMGRVRLVLRNPDDDQVAETTGTEATDLFSGVSSGGDRGKEWGSHSKASDKSAASSVLGWLQHQSKPEVSQPPAGEPQERFTMELLKGDELSRVEFSRSGKDGRWSSAGSDMPAGATSVPAPSASEPGSAQPGSGDDS
jgi:pilus assembly protein CpaB